MATVFTDLGTLTLFVDLRTDFTRAEFRTVEIHLIESLSPKRRQATYAEFIPIAASGDLIAGIRLTEVHGLTRGTYSLVVRLLDGRGASIGMTTSIIDLRGNQVVGARIHR
jgi:hypothetical protein